MALKRCYAGFSRLRKKPFSCTALIFFIQNFLHDSNFSSCCWALHLLSLTYLWTYWAWPIFAPIESDICLHLLSHTCSLKSFFCLIPAQHTTPSSLLIKIRSREFRQSAVLKALSNDMWEVYTCQVCTNRWIDCSSIVWRHSHLLIYRHSRQFQIVFSFSLERFLL